MDLIHYKNNHNSSSLSLPQLTTPTKIMRKLSHSKIIVHHFPHLLKSGPGDEPLSVEVEVETDAPTQTQLTPQRGRKDLTSKLKGLSFGKYLGLILALMASVTMSLMTMLVKKMSHYHAFSIVLWRLQGVLFPSVGIILAYLKCGSGCGGKSNDKNWILEGVWPARWKIIALLVARGLFGCSADILQYLSLKYLSLADSSVIAFSTPIFVTFVAYFTLGEKLGLVPILMGVLSLLGVGIMSRPPMLTGAESFDTDILIGNALALGCMGMATVTFILLRTLRSVHFSLSTFSFGFFGSVEVLILCGITSTFELPQGASDWAFAALLVGMNFMGQMFLTLALQLEDAGPVALVRSCDVIFAFLWQYLFFNVVPDVFSVIGGTLVITGVVVTALRKFVEELSPEDKRRKWLQFLLK